MATNILSLVLGSTTIPLAVGDAWVLEYMPQSPQLAVAGAGLHVYSVERQLVTETVRVLFYGDSVAAVQAKISAVERWIEGAHRWQMMRTGDVGYLQMQLVSDSEMWRSEVVSARLHLADENMRRLEAGAEVLLVITRKPWWETAAERELPLDNGSAGAKATGGVTIFNHDDGDSGHDNWVDVAAADVVGNVPSPLRLVIKNTTGVNLATREFYQANNVFHSPSTFAHMLEGEASAWTTTVADAASSGGNFGRASWVNLIDHVVNLFHWVLSSSLLAATAGGFFRVLVRFANTPPSGIEMQLHVKFPADTADTTLWAGPKMTSTGGKLQDLGVVQLPPGIASAGHNEVALVLSAKYTGTSQLDIDFVQLTPADSTRRFAMQGYQLRVDEQVFNDGPVDRVYSVDPITGLEWNNFGAYSAALHVWPGRDQRLIFLHDEDGNMRIARSWLVRAWYRPRRLLL